jgi:hypothetical protein
MKDIIDRINDILSKRGVRLVACNEAAADMMQAPEQKP